MNKPRQATKSVHGRKLIDRVEVERRDLFGVRNLSSFCSSGLVATAQTFVLSTGSAGEFRRHGTFEELWTFSAAYRSASIDGWHEFYETMLCPPSRRRFLIPVWIFVRLAMTCRTFWIVETFPCRWNMTWRRGRHDRGRRSIRRCSAAFCESIQQLDPVNRSARLDLGRRVLLRIGSDGSKALQRRRCFGGWSRDRSLSF